MAALLTNSFLFQKNGAPRCPSKKNKAKRHATSTGPQPLMPLEREEASRMLPHAFTKTDRSKRHVCILFFEETWRNMNPWPDPEPVPRKSRTRHSRYKWGQMRQTTLSSHSTVSGAIALAEFSPRGRPRLGDPLHPLGPRLSHLLPLWMPQSTPPSTQ